MDNSADPVCLIMEQHQSDLPERMQRSMRYMVRNRLLQSYRSMQGIADALRGIKTRLKRPVRLREAVRDLEEHYDAFREDFDRFFPQLIEFARDQDRLDCLRE